MFSHDELEQPTSKKIGIHVPGPSDISQDLDCRPIHPGLRIFPEVDGRKFQASWYLSKLWLEYSQKDNVIYCIPCRHFAHSTSAFRAGGMSNFKKGTNKIKKHDTSKAHIFAMQRWMDHKRTKGTGYTIATQLNLAHEMLVKQNNTIFGVW